MSFDPYHKWLGIAPEEQPPNHYRLLGINLFESDADVVSNAADQRMAHVRSFQAGRHSDCSQRLLNEIASARVCLLDPEEKAKYDAALRVHLAPASAPARIIPTAVPLSQAVASPPAPSAVPRAVPSKRHDAEESTPSTLPDLVVRDQPVNVVATRPRPGLTFLPLAIAAIVGVLAVVVAFAILLGSGVLGRREVVQELGDRQSPAVTPGRASPAESGDEQAGEIPPGENPDDPLAATGPAHGDPPPINGSATSSTESTQENGTAPPREDGEHQTTDGAGNEMPDERTTDTTVTKSVQPDNDSVLSARQRLEAMVANESPKQLIERARARTDNDADSFVILLMAKERAATAGDVGMAVAAMDELDTRFEIDAFDTKMELLTQLTVDENQKLDHRRLAELVLSLVDVALQRDRSDLAKDCATAALGAARESGDSRLVREATLAIVKLQKP